MSVHADDETVHKAVTAAIAGTLTVVTTAFADNVFELSETGHVIASVVSLGILIWSVYRVPNKRKSPVVRPDTGV